MFYSFFPLLIQIENSAEEFALYVVHTSGGKSEGPVHFRSFN